jgi:hypothetical protein
MPRKNISIPHKKSGIHENVDLPESSITSTKVKASIFYMLPSKEKFVLR